MATTLWGDVGKRGEPCGELAGGLPHKAVGQETGLMRNLMSFCRSDVSLQRGGMVFHFLLT